MPAKIVMPSLATFWFIFTSPIVLIDACYVLLRAKPGEFDDPAKHPWGEVPPLMYWNTYAHYDHRYQANDDAFVVAQSYLNLVEMVLGMVAISIALLGWYRSGLAMAMLVSIMTIYKTVIFFLMDVVEESKFTKHNTTQDKLLMIWLPSSFWIIIPSIILFQLFAAYGKEERDRQEMAEGKNKKKQ